MGAVKSLKLAIVLVALVGFSPETLVAYYHGGGWGAGLGIGLGTGLLFGGLAAAASRDRNVYVIENEPSNDIESSSVITKEQPDYIETGNNDDQDDINRDDGGGDGNDEIGDGDTDGEDDEKIDKGPGNDLVVAEEITEA